MKKIGSLRERESTKQNYWRKKLTIGLKIRPEKNGEINHANGRDGNLVGLLILLQILYKTGALQIKNPTRLFMKHKIKWIPKFIEE